MSYSQKARMLHRNYFVELEQKADQNWVVTSISNGYTGSSLLPPAFNYPDLALAEQYARAAIDIQLSAS